jgi:hypothetical protein
MHWRIVVLTVVCRCRWEDVSSRYEYNQLSLSWLDIRYHQRALYWGDDRRAKLSDCGAISLITACGNGLRIILA